MNNLLEDSRRQLIDKGKKGQNYKYDWSKGRNRYERRLHSHIANSVRQYNNIDMNKLFKDDILTVGIKIQGETADYIVRISFGGFLDILRDTIGEDQLTVKHIIKALVRGFNQDDVYIGCSCPDFFYRFGYWATKNNIISIDPQNIPSDITNPNDTLGSGCKHVLLVLANTSWLIKVASVIYNYINYMRDHMQKAYADIIYPAIYGKEYEEPVQLDIFDDTLDSEQSDIDVANAEARKRGQFQKGNPYRYTSTNAPIEDQETIEDEVIEEP